MNREIKFRAKDVTTKEWRYGYLYKGIPETNTTYIIPEFLYNGYEYQDKENWSLRFEKYYEVDYETASLYIGINDYVGVEIYEGDVLVCTAYCPGNGYKTTPVWKDGKYLSGYKATAEDFNDTLITDDELKIIGNIYEHPTLLTYAQ